MIPVRLSASSLQVWELCHSRWFAEYMDKSRGMSNKAADTGTAFHAGCEMFVDVCYIKKTHQPTLELLISYYQMGYVQTFKTADLDTPEFKDGLELTKKWFKRTDFSKRIVLSVEKMEEIKVPFNKPDGSGQDELPFVYVINRLDEIGEDSYEVVDYKTVRLPVQPEDLETKIQARAYALAVQIKYPNAKSIKVTFDLIRHEPVSMFFTRDDNIAFWKFLCETTQEVVNTPPEDVRPTLNMECGYCPIKYTCKTLQKNVSTGGIHSLGPAEQAELLYKIQAQMKAYKNIEGELKDMILRHAASTQTVDWESEDSSGSTLKIAVSAGRSRNFDFQKAADIMGPELVKQMGKMNLGELDKITKDESLPKEMRDALKDLIYWENGSFRVDIKPKSGLI